MLFKKQELAFHGHNESADSVNMGNYVELLKYTAQYDVQLEEHFPRYITAIQNVLINAVSSALNDVVKEEITKAEFVFILFGCGQ